MTATRSLLIAAALLSGMIAVYFVTAPVKCSDVQSISISGLKVAGC